MKKILFLCLLFLSNGSVLALEKSNKVPFKGHETFDDVSPERFSTFAAKNTSISNGVLWTRGKSGGKYAPMVRVPIKETDCTISFRYRFLGKGGFIWLFINGDDGFGGYDHLLRIKLLRNGIAIQVDDHTQDPQDPKLTAKQKKRKPDRVSGAYRVSEKLPTQKLNLEDNDWHELKLVFKKDKVSITLDDNRWSKELNRAGFQFEKQGINWMKNGGELGIEIDDFKVISH